MCGCVGMGVFFFFEILSFFEKDFGNLRGSGVGIVRDFFDIFWVFEILKFSEGLKWTLLGIFLFFQK